MRGEHIMVRMDPGLTSQQLVDATKGARLQNRFQLDLCKAIWQNAPTATMIILAAGRVVEHCRG